MGLLVLSGRAWLLDFPDSAPSEKMHRPGLAFLRRHGKKATLLERVGQADHVLGGQSQACIPPVGVWAALAPGQLPRGLPSTLSRLHAAFSSRASRKESSAWRSASSQRATLASGFLLLGHC